MARQLFDQLHILRHEVVSMESFNGWWSDLASRGLIVGEDRQRVMSTLRTSAEWYRFVLDDDEGRAFDMRSRFRQGEELEV